MKDDVLKRFRGQVSDPVHDDLIGELEPPALPALRSTETGGRFNRITVGAIGASSLALVAFGALVLGGGEKTVAPIPQSLAVASAAAAVSDPEGVQYTRTKVLTLGTTGNPPYSYYGPLVSEAWVRDDGSGRLRTTKLPVRWPGPRDRARALAENDLNPPGLPHPDQTELVEDARLSADQLDQSFGGGSLPPVRGLSSDPTELRSQLEAFVSGGGPTDVVVFELASGVLLKPNVDGPVRAAAYEVLGQLPGVVVDRSASDPLGRATTSASITSDYTGAESARTVYFDPKSSRAFAFTDSLSGPEDFIDSRTLASVVLTEARTVSSVP